MNFKNKLKKFKFRSKKLIQEKNIKDVVFSENIYEIEIYDPELKENFWPFLQIDDQKNILDAFCSCKEQEKEGFCPHLAASYYYINKNAEPLHVEFKKSFWNALFKITSFQVGFDQKLLKKKKEGFYYYLSDENRQIFSIEVQKNQIKKLKEILKETPINQQTSIKFSGISLDEINLIKEGRASDQLKYELSFFSDLAKWFFLMQEDEVQYKIIYKSQDDIFNEIEVCFLGIKAIFYVPLAYLEEIIPTLNTVDSLLKLYEYEGLKIKEIRYDKVNCCFNIEKTKGFFKEESQKKEGIKVGSFIYIKNIGFYPIQPDELLENDIIQKEKISYFLTKYRKIFEEKLTNEKINIKPVSANYYLFFDENENFNINLYVFEKEDFERPYSAFFHPWAYFDDRGFYLLENLYFDTAKKVIKKENVSEFVGNNRTWLHNFEGFKAHFGSFQSHLIFSVTENKDLVFSSKLEFPEELGSFIDLEDWIYIKGIGFFSKQEKRLGLPIRPGLIVKKSEIAKFIETHKEELEQIEGFFLHESPLEKIGLNIHLNESMQIEIVPEIKLKEGYDLQQMLFFEKFVYLKKSGFFEFPKAFSLPPRYEEKKIIPEEQEEFFITFELQRLKPYILYLDNRLKNPQNLILKLNNILKRKRKNKTFFLIDLIYESEIGFVNSSEIYKALAIHKKYVFTPAGLILLKKTRFNWLRNLKKSKVLKKDQFIELSTLDIIRLFLLEDVQIPKIKSKEAEKARQLLEELSTFETDRMLDISLLKASLRPYQELGIKWLWFLYVNNLSGLLCDEMGLGKTHQSMALLASVHKLNGFKYLVVCPTSVIYHWEELLKKFLPSIRVYVYYGLSRNLEKFTKDYDLLLTSYGIIRSERENFKKLKFEIAIYDEIQIAKNANSLTHKALRSIDSNMRLGLTGTPIENYLRELKSIFDLILPSYFPSESAFKEFFITPIEKENDQERKKILKKLINPFILRRKKKDVLKDLPEKIEEIAYADLSQEQITLYNEIITKSKETIIKNIQDTKQPVPYVHIFSILSKLKQVCDHPSLIYKDIDKYSEHASGKFDLFVELLDEAKESSQKIVIFSQYLNMIKIIEDHLKKNSIGYAIITGATKKRFKEIKKFKEDPNCMVFVASLLAAGVGIDLSAGSVVIHYDRWWNPAKENQATDRVHRIGQNRGVQVFKLVSKNTIEERIHSIIERKKTLIEETIGVDEVDQIKVLSREELIEVLSKIDIISH
jgi:SNF2 family DNA or RNA helicase